MKNKDEFNYSEIILEKPYSTTEAGRFLGVSSTTIREMYEDGEIEGYFARKQLKIKGKEIARIRGEYRKI